MDRSLKSPGGDLKEWKELIAVGAAFGLAESAGLSLRLGEAVYGAPEQDGITWQPLDLAIRMATGDVAWTGAATAGALTLVVGTAATAAGSVWVWKAACAKCSQLAGKRRGRREKVDSQARYLAHGKELAGVGRRAVAAKAADLRVELGKDQEPGVSIGRAVLGGQMLYGSYEDLHLDIWGPRQGKSSSRVIPAVMEAVGPVVTTSNKRDVVDATRDPRAELGKVWVFDPQGVAEEAPTWFWDPVAWVYGSEDGHGAQERAIELAGHFAAGGDADKKDSFFDPEGEDLLSGLILAAAVAKRPITQVFKWVTKPSLHEPIKLLDAAGFDMVAAALADQYNAPDRQRAGIFSTAKKMASCLKLASIAQWVSPPVQGEQPREAFDAAAFVSSTETLYPLSLEGKTSAGPLVTALTAAVAAEASKLATRQGGRLRVPLTVLLDEAANIVKWASLPAQYSHFGSRGIVVMTVLQSYAQGVRCWGVDGMKALFGAANVKVLGSGLGDADFLRLMSDLVGPHYEHVTSISRDPKGAVSRSTNRIKEPTFEISDLASLPRGRALVFVSGQRPTLVRTIPWQERSYADAVRKSNIAHDPANTSTQTSGRHLRVVPPPVDEQQEGESA
ncbi:TraM recognition domain-containing protein [Nocardia sp. NPDC051756]|uniref:type IV secretory system conjugative DNA transfer family protein n=1 Tax=Nocardia sp. NPDC051756 TaxID=3154751 RepID=UPI0034430B01